MGAPIDVVTDQTSAHDPLAYLPADVAFEDWQDYARDEPEEFIARCARVDGPPRRGDGRLPGRRAPRSSTTATRSAPRPSPGGCERAFDFPGFVPAYIRPLFCEGKGPFRWVALSGDPKDIAATDRAVLDLFPRERVAGALDRAWPREKVALRGAAGAHLLARLRRARTRRACASTSSWRRGEISAPIVIGRDHLDCGSVASPYRETEAMLDGSDAIADWPLLNAMVNTASGRSWVSIHHGGGVGIGRSIHAGQVTRRRRDAAGRAEARAGPDQRPGDRASSATSTPATSARRRSRASEACGCRCGRPSERPTTRTTRGSAATAWTPHVLIDVDGERIGRCPRGRRAVRPAADAPARRHAAGPRERALACVPPRAARPHAPIRRHVLDLARGHVRGRRPPDPDSYHALARATYAEMALAGITCVGEFHYLHHDTGGVPYDDANAFGEALSPPLPTPASGSRCSTPATWPVESDDELQGPQLRFGDADAEAWAERASDLRGTRHARVWAPRSTRYAPCPRSSSRPLSPGRTSAGAPLHFHLSEQRAENEACLAAHGRTPDGPARGPRRARGALLRGARHAPDRRRHRPARRLGHDDLHVPDDRARPGRRDRARRALGDAGSPLSLGSDSNAVVDPFEEARAVELDERLASERRGHWDAAELLRAATADGNAPLGWPEGGRLAVGALADFTTIGLDSVRLAGAAPGDAPGVAGLRGRRRRRARGRRRRPAHRHRGAPRAGRRRRRASSTPPSGRCWHERPADRRHRDARHQRPLARRRAARPDLPMPPLVLGDGIVRWAGARGAIPQAAADERVDAGRARGHPRLCRQPWAPRLRRRPDGRVRRPDGRAALTARRHRDHRGRHPSRHVGVAQPRTWRGWWPRRCAQARRPSSASPATG